MLFEMWCIYVHLPLLVSLLISPLASQEVYPPVHVVICDIINVDGHHPNTVAFNIIHHIDHVYCTLRFRHDAIY